MEILSHSVLETRAAGATLALMVLKTLDVLGPQDELGIVLINRPDQPAVGAGEPATVTTAAAVANAIYDATGARLRRIPFTPERVKAALLAGRG